MDCKSVLLLLLCIRPRAPLLCCHSWIPACLCSHLTFSPSHASYTSPTWSYCMIVTLLSWIVMLMFCTCLCDFLFPPLQEQGGPLPACQFACLSVCLPPTRLPVCLSVFLSACLPTSLPEFLYACHLPAYWSACISVCLPVCLSFCLSICLCFCMPATCLPTGLSVSLSAYQSACISVCLSPTYATPPACHLPKPPHQPICLPNAYLPSCLPAS